MKRNLQLYFHTQQKLSIHQMMQLVIIFYKCIPVSLIVLATLGSLDQVMIYDTLRFTYLLFRIDFESVSQSVITHLFL